MSPLLVVLHKDISQMRIFDFIEAKWSEFDSRPAIEDLIARLLKVKSGRLSLEVILRTRLRSYHNAGFPGQHLLLQLTASMHKDEIDQKLLQERSRFAEKRNIT
ncbi:hypothetical protein NC653_024108 [Populus alba x Populus x berolinensis]|uniref:Uncharacterized protein n=1 Tax=Populus alba x Populus x berolinensis TaxID=444605 RepID=A0AAD6M840_9ROSI|nr:hypothetical protein NC653_024108 [Populus alba x Populus x berolinensis]